MWNIVEFDDSTVQIVPDCWVSSDQKTCYWPPNGLFKSNTNYLKDVKKCVSPSINWSIYNVLLVLGKYDNFEKALKKLKKAEDHTDLTTDVEKEKKNRKNRKKKKYSSSSSEELNPTKINIKPLPEPPTVSNVNLNKTSTSKFHNSIHQTTTPSLAHNKQIEWSTLFYSSEESMSSDGSLSSDELDKNENQENSKNLLNNANDEHKSDSDAVNYTPTIKAKRALEYSTCDTTKIKNMKRKKKASSLSDTEFKSLVLRQLAVIKVNIKKLDDRIKNLKHSNTTILSNSTQETNLNDLMEEFPINTEESLKKIELSLTDKTYKLNLTAALSKLGGSKTDEATKFILRKLFSDKLAMTYSWCGGKGKRVMSSLNISRVIIDSVFKIIKTATEAEIILSIKNWMRHAKKRNENCEKRYADSTEQMSLPINE
ncbi:uncharacterized protein LOC132938763 [Metopolophium dirhodum]|uniref:uncharacterized protein LOC132938763 n=1 Tax=Metopolophium dirhodum TaxID=44670 RepID=UPI00298F7A5D|nr:uncharacterized protein LOC132938763 [Metopolophium dirhodum]